MTISQEPKAKPSRKSKAKAQATVPSPRVAKTQVVADRKPSRTAVLIALMRADGGASAQALAEAVGWQVHSVRGFISGTLKKRTDLKVSVERVDGATRYSVSDAEAAAQ